MAQRTFPRSDRHHDVAAGDVLSRHALHTGKPIALPVPVEQIIEDTYGLQIDYDEIAEQPGEMILGALSAATKRIVLNTRHERLLSNIVGPERFTLAHELGHWVYDAEHPGQQTLDLHQSQSEVFCYRRETPGLSDQLALREVNANRFASALLLPTALVRELDIDELLQDFRRSAHELGVSPPCLAIRLTALNLVDPGEVDDWLP